MKWTWFYVLIVNLLVYSEALKILVVFPMPSKSHIILGDGIVKPLLAAGHEITYITASPVKNPPSKLRQIDVSANFNLMTSGIMFDIKSLMDSKTGLNNPADMMRLFILVHRTTMKNENVQRFINDPKEEFDLVLVEWMGSELYAGLHAIYDCPFIWFSSMQPHSMILSLIDEKPNAAYTPDILSTNLPPFNFFQRLQELLTQILFSAVKELYLVHVDNNSYQEFIVPAIEKRRKKAPEFNDLRLNASMILGNGHVSLGVPVSLPPNYISIGGYYIDKDIKPLPQDLQQLMDGAKNGVIYFSMGSNLKSKDMPDKMKRNLLKLFGTLKQTVLWKFEENLSNLPKNVHILNWAPQQSILSHPNLLVFISHGGFLSTNEAVHFGVPIIGIPGFGDQFINVDRAVQQGFALRVDLAMDIDEKLKMAIEKMLTDPKYKQRVKELSLMYHDRPVPPAEELVFWVEHVVKTRGAPHLRSPALHTPLYQKLFLDVLAATFVALYVFKSLIIVINMMKWPLLIISLVNLLIYSEALKILVVFPMPGRSHAILGDGIVKHLLAAGHEVSYITAIPIKNPPPKLHQIDVSANFDATGGSNFFDLKTIMESKIGMNNPAIAVIFLTQIHRTTMENENVQKFIKDPKQQFDVILAEWMYSELYSGLSAVYDCPLIWFSSLPPHWMILNLIDENANAAYTPDSVSLNLPPFNFFQRFREVFIQILTSAVRELYMVRVESNSYQELIVPAIERRGKKAPEFQDIRLNSSMILGNGHASLGVPIKLPQNYKYIGGHHIDKDVKPLPQDLQKLMDGAKNGVVYFSMGSNLKSKDMPEEMKKNLLKYFGTLKQTVLWKFEEDLANVPKNVHILNWAPQQSILSHPNLLVFISHGGFLSTNEAVHFGVPIIGIPAFGDQFINVDRAVQQGFALRVDLSIDIDVPLKVAVDTILSNPKYKQRVKELSVMYHDRPVTPAEELVFWVEHVVKTRGAPHLRSPALHTPLYQKLFLDVLVVTLVGSYAFIILVKKICCRKKSSSSKKDKTQ
ncbi:hypothetical protein K1T71_012104 [Dendrolimus kikuchii]|uniref:Uncharacterized protein n=1 Tax=Dendrolimus kikuchii TaxID=765133 RepID=A0ACC1CL15_9NEOP|nr:hypothetical protein K1T71_012104 [Dendrolimus kikuchii]